MKWVNKAEKLSNYLRPINCLMTRKAALDIASFDLWEQASEIRGNLVTVKRVTLGVTCMSMDEGHTRKSARELLNLSVSPWP